jgi:hypothetical protein
LAFSTLAWALLALAWAVSIAALLFSMVACTTCTDALALARFARAWLTRASNGAESICAMIWFSVTVVLKSANSFWMVPMT